jgi:hypothetical protein
MRGISLLSTASLVATVAALGAGCSVADDPAPPPPVAGHVTLGGSYVAKGSSPLAEIGFYDNERYSARKAGCGRTAPGCMELGTYSIDAANGELVLQASSGAVTRLKLAIPDGTAPAAARTGPSTASIRPLAAIAPGHTDMPLIQRNVCLLPQTLEIGDSDFARPTGDADLRLTDAIKRAMDGKGYQPLRSKSDTSLDVEVGDDCPGLDLSHVLVYAGDTTLVGDRNCSAQNTWDLYTLDRLTHVAQYKAAGSNPGQVALLTHAADVRRTVDACDKSWKLAPVGEDCWDDAYSEDTTSCEHGSLCIPAPGQQFATPSAHGKCRAAGIGDIGYDCTDNPGACHAELHQLCRSIENRYGNGNLPDGVPARMCVSPSWGEEWGWCEGITDTQCEDPTLTCVRPDGTDANKEGTCLRR